MGRLVGCGLLLVTAALAFADESSSLRYIEFRDGSVLRLPFADEEWKVTVIKPTGAVEEVRVRSTDLSSASLTSEPGFEKKRALLATVQQLGSEFFRERERAYATLLTQGPTIRPDLETCLEFAVDLETRARLRNILSALAETPAPTRSARSFDLFTLKQPTWGHLGDEGIAVLIDGKKHRIARKDIHGFSMAPPAGLIVPGVSSASSDVRRMNIANFGADVVEESFEKTLDGRPLRIGENIEKLFISKGFTLSTSMPGTWVSVNNFQVMGKSKGMSAATHNPLWEGEITIRFCQPGREGVPAGVTQFGCYLAAVMPSGTAMIAYDVQGRQLGTVHTQNNGHDFLGISSPVPMHRIRIVPNLQLDKDYTLDDFIFTRPVWTEAAHPEKFIAQLAAGDRVVCDDVAFVKEGVRLLGMPGRLPDRTIALEEVLRINTPEKKGDNALQDGIFVELRDGSVLFSKMTADKPGRPMFARKPSLFQETNHLAGLWSSEYPRMLPPDNRPRIWNNQHGRWDAISDVRFENDMVTYKFEDQPRIAAYAKLPPLWFTLPPESPATATWRIRTRQGEELVLSEPIKLEGRLSQKLSARWQGRTIQLEAGELAAVIQIRK